MFFGGAIQRTAGAVFVSAWLCAPVVFGGGSPAPEPKKNQEQSAKASSAEKKQDPSLVEIRKAIRVFRVETAQLSERRSGASGRGGSTGSRWHGRVYEYVRNNFFDAVPHEVVQRGGDKNHLRRNQFGFSVSGPVTIPKIYDGARKSFFTFSFEGTREKVGRSYLRTLPTSLQRSGDFSDLVNKAGNPVTVYDPRSTRANAAFDPEQKVSTANLEFVRDPYPNNVVPASQLDPVAQNISEHYPEPNTNVGPFLQNNYWANPVEVNNPTGFLVRVDHHIGKRHKLTLNLAHSEGFNGNPRIYPTIGNPGSPDRQFLDRSVEISETFEISPAAIYRAEVQASSEGSETPALNDSRDLPQEMGIRGVTGNVFPAFRFKDYYGLGASSGRYYRNYWHTYSTEHSLNLRRGNHTWDFEVEFDAYQLNTMELESPSGSFRFNDEMTGLPGINNTGNSFASFLLGRSYRAEATDLLQPSYLRRKSVELSVRDNYEVTPNLTATLGLNIDTSTPRVEKFDRQSTVDLTKINPANERPGALVFAGREGESRSFQPVRMRLEPSLGLAWSPSENRNTVVRASFRRYYGSIGLRPGPFGTQGFSGRRTLISPNFQLAPAVVLDEGVPGLGAPLPHLDPTAANGSDPDIIAKTSRQPTYNYASLSLERKLPYGLTMRALGRVYRARNLLVGGSVAGINQIPLDFLSFRDALNNEPFRRSLRPFPQFLRFQTDSQYPLGRYKYERADFSLEKRAGGGLTFDFTYSMLKRRDDYSGPGVQDPYNRRSAWALSRGTRPHRLSLSYVYELPFGHDKPVLNQASWLDTVLGDWSLSGFTSWYSGDPIVLDPVFNNTGGVVNYLRVNAVPGVDAHVDNPGPGQWFNPLAFVDPDPFTAGNVSRTHPTLRNPNYQNHDLAITKRVPISQEKSLELLFQGFNFLNQGNWYDPDTEIGPEGARNANAGKIIGSRGGRVIQLGLRYNF